MEFGRYRYLKMALVMAAASTIAFVLAQPPMDAFEVPFGSTWTGYGLGTLGAVLILLLSWFGIRRRSYRSTMGTVKGWLSAHIYLGMALVVVATLHTGFQFGWNVHTLAYSLMMAVIASGVFGLVVYVRLPTQIGRNVGDETLDAILLSIADLDRAAHTMALELPDNVVRMVDRAAKETRIGGSALAQLRGTQRDCPTEAALLQLEPMNASFGGKTAEVGFKLFGLLAKRAVLVRRARRDVQLRAWLAVWLYVHVPLTVALLVALLAHVVSVFLYR